MPALADNRLASNRLTGHRLVDRQPTESWPTENWLADGHLAEAGALAAVLQDLQALRDGQVMPAEGLRRSRRLWQSVLIALADPASDLPPPLRQGLARLGLAVLAELARPQPDFDLLIAINTQWQAAPGERDAAAPPG